MATTVADEKKNLRAIMIACREALDNERAATWSEIVERQVIASEFYRDASAVVLYKAHRNEVSTDHIFADAQASGRAVFYPRVDSATGMIVARWIRSHAELTPGVYGFPEPRASAEALDTRDKKFAEVLGCVPGVAFGLEGLRLGRGGGHYD